MVDFLIQIFRSSYETLYIATFIVAVFLFISGLDDLFVDIYYWLHYIFNRRKFNKFRYERREKIINLPEKPIAIYIPAWHEHDVIDTMLLNAVKTIQYSNYDIFVGVYPNDPATIRKVEEVSRRHPNVHAVISDNPGPTTKANNLNQIHEGMIKWENKTGKRYEIIVMHDSEDVIHPMSLKVHNALIPEFDMVQLPVFPLHTDHMNLVHWTYADEFAENHTKDLFARQYFSGFVPSAGVGTAFNRWIIEFIGSSYAKNIFRTKCLTEDYDLALRLALGKANMLFAYKPFGIDCATRGYFPHTMQAAIRQKSRWITGICLQSWQTIGWRGDARFKFVLYRDRKAVITNMVNFLAYIVVIYLMLYELVRLGFSAYRDLPSIVTQNTTLWYLVIIDTLLMIWRMLHRFISVKRVYGVFAALLSIIRSPVSNIINFSATSRALYMFAKSLLSKKELKWEKTRHHFPAVSVPREWPR